MDYKVYQRKSDNKFVAYIYLGKDESGKMKRIVCYGNTEKEAVKKIKSKIFDIENGLIDIDKKETLINFLNEYINRNRKDWAETTLALYNSYIKQHIEPYFKDKKVDALKPIDIDDFYDLKLENGLGPNTVLKLHKFLNAAFNFGVKKEMIRRNVCEKATPPKFVEYKPNIYEEEQFLQLWQHVKDKYDRVPIILGAGCGLRRGEIFGLKWSDIDFKNSTISIDRTRTRYNKDIVKDPKNRFSKRTVNAPDYVMQVLKDYKKEIKVVNIDNWVLEITPGYYSKRFKLLLERFNLPPTRLHDLRHYNATLMMNVGIPDRIAADRLGHKDTTTLKKIYQHTQKTMDKIASDRINDLLAKKM